MYNICYTKVYKNICITFVLREVMSVKKGTTGTHYKAEERRRDQVFSLRLTAAEMAELREKARLLGLPLGEYLVESGIRRRVKGYVKPEAAPEDEQIPGQMKFDVVNRVNDRVTRGRTESSQDDFGDFGNGGEE